MYRWADAGSSFLALERGQFKTKSCILDLDKCFLASIQYMGDWGVTQLTFATDSLVPTSEGEGSWETIWNDN